MAWFQAKAPALLRLFGKKETNNAKSAMLTINNCGDVYFITFISKWSLDTMVEEDP